MKYRRTNLTASRLTEDQIKESWEEVLWPSAEEAEMLMPLTYQDQPNEPLVIYTGGMSLTLNDLIIQAEGEINFSWFPFPAVRLSCHAATDLRTIDSWYHSNQTIVVDTQVGVCGEVQLNRFGSTSKANQTILSGIASPSFYKGDNTIPVSVVRFELPNFIGYDGNLTWTAWESKLQRQSSRLTLQLGIYICEIDQLGSASDLQRLLSISGGYFFMHTGSITRADGKVISYNEVGELMIPLAEFLSLVTGRYVTPHFWKGCHGGEIKWEKFTSYRVSPYKSVRSWMPKNSNEHLLELSRNYYEARNKNSAKDFWSSLIHWYTEANCNAGLVDGALIFAQTALELIYNYWIVETLGLLRGRDAESISAANKLRLILAQIGLPSTVPDTLPDLKKFIAQDKELHDAADGIVFLRNSLVHGNLSKRKKYASVPANAIAQALFLSLHYVELSMLKLLGYNGKYYDRCVLSGRRSSAEKYVPWMLEPKVDKN